VYGLHWACWHTKSDAAKHTERNATRYTSARHAFEEIADTRHTDEIIRTARKSSNHPNSAVLQLDAGTRYTFEKIVERRHDQKHVYIRIARKDIDYPNSETLQLDPSHL
jgi:hypothetical protein